VGRREGTAGSRLLTVTSPAPEEQRSDCAVGVRRVLKEVGKRQISLGLRRRERKNSYFGAKKEERMRCLRIRSRLPLPFRNVVVCSARDRKGYHDEWIFFQWGCLALKEVERVWVSMATERSTHPFVGKAWEFERSEKLERR